MKTLKIFFLLVTLISLGSCNSDDDSLLEQNVTGTIDVSALINLQDNDATALVTLNGESASTFTSEVLIGGEVFYQINTTSSNVEIVILDFFYTSGNREFWTNSIVASVDSQSSSPNASLKVISGAVGDEVKFGFTFVLKTDGVIDMDTTFIVDPKIRVRG